MSLKWAKMGLKWGKMGVKQCFLGKKIKITMHISRLLFQYRLEVYK
jgi:hypothetical protein